MFLLMLSCGNSKIEKSLIEPNSTWVFSRTDQTTGKEIILPLRFEKNGYAFETETILRYTYSVFNNSFTIDGREFDIIRVSDNGKTIYLKHKKNKTSALLKQIN